MRTVAKIVVALVWIVTAPWSRAESGEAFLTPWGHPDLQGVWDYRTITPLEKPTELGERNSFTQSEAEQFTRTNPDRQAEAFRPLLAVGGEPWADVGTKLSEGARASLLYDPPSGRLPSKTDFGKQHAARTMERFVGAPDNPEDRPEQERCIIYPRIPLESGQYNNNIQIFQTPDHVVLLMEMFHDARIVPLNGRPKLPIKGWLGQSRGYYEGDTLVVETSGFRPVANFVGYSAQRTVVERFTRLDETTLLYDYSVDDPGAFTASWSARQTLSDRNEKIYEYACHEGNYSMVNMLRGARIQEAEQARRTGP
jgi:hypothetical protein